MMELRELLDKCINKNLIDLTISGQKIKNEDEPARVKVRPVMIKDELKYQASEYVGKKVLHINYSEDGLKKRITEYMNSFRQAQFTMVDASATVLSSKSGTLTCKYKKLAQIKSQKELSHNRTKKYILREGEKVDFLVDLGVMTKEGIIVKSKYDKFRQINRFLEFIEDILPQLDKEKEQTIIDFGCGKSYLTFAMYYYLRIMKGYNIRIIGLDLKKDVISHCNELRTRYGYDKLDFYEGDIASYKGVDRVDMVVTLHACDTATDYALAKAVGWGAKVILSVPCCQHEANRTIDSDMLSPIMDYGILKERFAAISTDAIRAKLLEAEGYQTQILEFIDMEHTPKNLLIRAVKTGNADKKALSDAAKMSKELNINLTLMKLLED
ncbi:MAG: SAM-dependent methyltransferase [Clostridia bacterium]|nr:SAM-dependent methyltransferase [Clostridia bacterium]